MHLPWRDVLASVLVGVALLAYGAWWLGGIALLEQASTVAVIVLALGVAASMSAVVPGFAELLHGSMSYMVLASALGVVALGAGLVAVMAEDGLALGLLVLSTVVLWAMSTLRHLAASEAAHPAA